MLTLGIARAADRPLTADAARWHKTLYDLKRAGKAPQLLSQLRFSLSSEDRPYSEDVERLLFMIDRAHAANRPNFTFATLTFSQDARQHIEDAWGSIGNDYASELNVISQTIAKELTHK